MIRLIATDLDGTLLEEDGTLPEGTFDVVRALGRMGIRFAASSGRQYGNLRRMFGPVAADMAFVCENGALCMVDGQTAGVLALDADTAKEVVEDIERRGMELLFSGRHTCYMLDHNRAYTDDIVYRLRNTVTMIERMDEIDEPILKISGFLADGVQDVAPGLLAKWSGRLTATVSGREWFDFTAANKGMGMRMLMRHMGLEAKEVAAFGDNFNDESMLDAVGHPFVMAHADPALHKPGYHSCSKVLPVLSALAATRGDVGAALRLLSE